MRTGWIRGPWWDGIWILSGLPIGAGLLLMSATAPSVVLILSFLVLFQTGHLLSPMALAWRHGGFRKIMLRQRGRYIMVPTAILMGTTAVGVIGGIIFADFHPDLGLTVRIYRISDCLNPFMIMVIFYTFWNAYHFAMQNFGILSIYRKKNGCAYGSRQRSIDMTFCLLVMGAATLFTFSGHLGIDRGVVRDVYGVAALVGILFMLLRERCLPRAVLILTDALGLLLIFCQGPWGFAIYAVNHWLVAIGLSSHVYANHTGRPPEIFGTTLIVIGVLGFGLLFVSPWTLTLHVTMPAAGLRVGLGFVHFLYDRYLYKFSDPIVAATIGKDIGF